MIQYVVSIITMFTKMLGSAIDFVCALLNGDFEGAFKAFVDLIKNSYIGSFIKDLISKIKELFEKIKEKFGLKRTTSTRWCIVEPTANGIIVPAWISRLRDSALANISKPVKKWFGGKRGVHVHRELPPYTSVYLSYRDERCVKIRIGSDNKEAYEQLDQRLL